MNPVALVTTTAMKNPYLLQSINEYRTLPYAVASEKAA